jgi:hypothetical protein
MGRVSGRPAPRVWCRGVTGHEFPAAGDDGVRQEFVKQSRPPSNRQLGDDAQAADLLVSLLHAATLRSKLDQVEFESLGLSLKRGLISLEGAVDWLTDLGLFESVCYPPDVAQGLVQ